MWYGETLHVNVKEADELIDMAKRHKRSRQCITTVVLQRYPDGEKAARQRPAGRNVDYETHFDRYRTDPRSNVHA